MVCLDLFGVKWGVPDHHNDSRVLPSHVVLLRGTRLKASEDWSQSLQIVKCNYLESCAFSLSIAVQIREKIAKLDFFPTCLVAVGLIQTDSIVPSTFKQSWLKHA